MLRITIELVPAGFQPLCRTIATMRLSNLSDLADVSDYLVEAMEGCNPLTGDPPRNAGCMVLARERRQGVWPLLERACRELMTADWVDL
jgi:hypothetical protein